MRTILTHSVSRAASLCFVLGLLVTANAVQAEEEAAAEKLKPWTLRVHYNRASGEYGNWGVYSWKGPQTGAPKWPANWKFNGKDKYGVYYDVALGEGANVIEFLITDGRGGKACGKDQKFVLPAEVATHGAEIWLHDSDCAISPTLPRK